MNVCSDDRDGRAWLDLREHYLADHPDAPADLPDRLRAPWCAVDLLPALFLDLQAVQWAGDFERLLAWTWCAWWT